MRGLPPIAILGAGLVAAFLIPLPALAGGGHGGHFGHGGHGHSFGHGFGHGHHRADAGHHGGYRLHFGYGGGHGDHGFSLSYGYGGSHHGYSLHHGFGGYAPYSGSHYPAYPAYGYGGGYSREIYRAPHRYAAPSQPLYLEPAPVALEDLAGWSHLSGGYSERALEVFAAQAAAYPGAGAPKVGYALSSALSGRHSRAIWAMRRAFRIDPYGASEVAIDAPTRDRLRELVGHYETGRGYRDSDDAFMGAALHYMLGQTHAARRAAERAVALGDHDPSVGNLLEMLPTRAGPGPKHARSAEGSPYGEEL